LRTQNDGRRIGRGIGERDGYRVVVDELIERQDLLWLAAQEEAQPIRRQLREGHVRRKTP